MAAKPRDSSYLVHNANHKPLLLNLIRLYRILILEDFSCEPSKPTGELRGAGHGKGMPTGVDELLGFGFPAPLF